MEKAFSFIKEGVSGLTEILLGVASLAILIEVIFGAGVFGLSIISNVMSIVTHLGEGGFVGLIALLVIFGLLKRK